MKIYIILISTLLFFSSNRRIMFVNSNSEWNVDANSERVLNNLVKVSGDSHLMVHDADFLIENNIAYITYIARDNSQEENNDNGDVYSELTRYSLSTNSVIDRQVIAEGLQVFDNRTLADACQYSPTPQKINDTTFRFYWLQVRTGVSAVEGEILYRDYYYLSNTFSNEVYSCLLNTGTLGNFTGSRLLTWMQSNGYTLTSNIYSMYLLGNTFYYEDENYLYGWISQFEAGKSIHVKLSKNDYRTFEVVGAPALYTSNLTVETYSEVKGDTIFAISRNQSPDFNYYFSQSVNAGVTWNTPAKKPNIISDGINSKPFLHYYNNKYHLGYQSNELINGVFRSRFKVIESTDFDNWQLRYDFKTERSFQYPTIRQYNNKIYIVVTQGNNHERRKEKIMFGIFE